MLDRGAHRVRAGTERRGFVEALRAQPDAASLGLGEFSQGSLIGLWTVE
jgi:hypothetical protein